MSSPRSLNDLTPSELERLIETITDMVSDRLGLPPDGASAAVASALPAFQASAAPAPPSSPPGGSAGASCSCNSCPSGPAQGGSGECSDRMSVPAGVSPAQCRDVARLIDHTLLKPDATEEDVLKLCEEAKKHGFASVCVNGSHVEAVANSLRGSGVKTCVVVGFPLGAMTPESKAFEARDAIRRGADEIDMVLNVGALKSRRYSEVQRDIAAVREATRGKVLKVILETSMLDDEEKRAGCVLSKAAEADFVKTSTGFGGGGATPEDVALMRAVVGPKMGVKASGGVRTCEDAAAMVSSGATRLGASAGVSIISGDGAKGSGY